VAHILVFEPDKNQRLLVAEELQNHGHFVRAVATVQEAIASVELFTPDVAIVEVATSDVPGPRLLGRLLGANPRLPVVVHTGNSRCMGETLAALVDSCVLKSSNLWPLVAAVHRVLRRAKLSAEPWGAAQLPVSGHPQQACTLAPH